MRKQIASLALAVLCLACTSTKTQRLDDRPTTYDAVLSRTQITTRPGGTMWRMDVHVVSQPVGTVWDLRTWPTGHFRWEILNLPPGVDGGRFGMASGTFQEALDAQAIDPGGTALLQGYYPPATLPPGTTRLELKIRVTITPPQGTPIAQTEIPLVIDVNAPALSPLKDRVQEGNPVVEENRGPR